MDRPMSMIITDSGYEHQKQQELNGQIEQHHQQHVTQNHVMLDSVILVPMIFMVVLLHMSDSGFAFGGFSLCFGLVLAIMIWICDLLLLHFAFTRPTIS